MPDPEVHGTVAPGFEGVRLALATNLRSGADIGASAAVTIDGELVADVWGGHLDEERTQPWQEDTIINVWSTTKTMASLCVLLLADRGALDLHAPVATYWPEFKAAGKEDVEVRHLLAHTSGLSGWQEPMAPEDLYDWERCTSLLAAQEPWWTPGTVSGYHAVTHGFLLGEVVRRVTGRTIGAFFADELAGPLGADFRIGTGPEHDHRIAPVIPPPPLGVDLAALGLPADNVAVRTLTNPLLDAARSFEIPWRRAELPAINGHGNARSVAQVQSVLACGGAVGGTRILSEAGGAAVMEEQSFGPDLVLQLPIRFGMGYALTSPQLPLGPNPNTCFWGGWGGSLVIVDRDARMVVAYVMNKMGQGTVGDFRSAGIAMAAYAGLARR
jgi:CubicO group peptidase (beta-lactamase class C family)